MGWSAVMERLASIWLEDKVGRWAHPVNWIAALRPIRFDYQGRTFDAAGQQADGTWIYRTAQDRHTPKPAAVRLEQGVARNFVAEFEIPRPVPDTLEYQDARYRRKGMSGGRYLYWHG
jgi:hypothetical protein